MEKVRPFYLYLHKFVSLTEEEFSEIILPHLKVREFEKKEFLLKEGQIEQYMNFILNGIVRKFYKKKKEQVNTQISFEGHIIHSQESFHSRLPSEYYVEAIEPTTVASIDYDDLENIYRHDSKMERLGRLVITFTMVQKDRWQMQMIKMGPRERFLHFVNRNPDLMRRVPQKYLASYLNIKPETFSRFKHLMKEQIFV